MEVNSTSLVRRPLHNENTGQQKLKSVFFFAKSIGNCCWELKERLKGGRSFVITSAGSYQPGWGIRSIKQIECSIGSEDDAKLVQINNTAPFDIFLNRNAPLQRHQDHTYTSTTTKVPTHILSSFGRSKAWRKSFDVVQHIVHLLIIFLLIYNIL